MFCVAGKSGEQGNQTFVSFAIPVGDESNPVTLRRRAWPIFSSGTIFTSEEKIPS